MLTPRRRHFSKCLASFFATDSGSIAVLFALCIMALFFAVGCAIDFVRFNNTKTHFEAAADAAALQVANSSKTSNTDQLSLARDVVDANYDAETFGEVVDLSIASTALTVSLTAVVRFETSFMKLAGITHIDTPILSEVTRSGSNLEVALVLDTTTSMDEEIDGIAKIDSLKSAAKRFVNAVVATRQSPFYSRVALIPYSAGVNVGSMATTARGTVAAGSSAAPGREIWSFRRGSRTYTYRISSCVTERTGTHKYSDRSVTANKVGRMYVSSLSECTANELMPLTSSRSALTSAIDDFETSNNTAGHIGIEWGWYTLSRDTSLWSGSFAPAAYGTPKLKKVAVIMTDGEFNTDYCRGLRSDRANPSGFCNNASYPDARNGATGNQAAALCTAMKAAGKDIEIYTIGFGIDAGSDQETLMRGCASKPANYYSASDDAGLDAAFADIGRQLGELRVSK